MLIVVDMIDTDLTWYESVPGDPLPVFFVVVCLMLQSVYLS